MSEFDDGLTAGQRAILLEVARLMSQRRSVAEVFAAFSSKLLQAAAFDYTALVMLEDDPRYVRIVGTYPSPLPPAAPGRVFTERSLRISELPAGPEGTQYRPSQVGSDSGDGFARGGFERVWSARMLAGDSTIGAITVARRSGKRFSAAEGRFLAEAGQLLAAALRQDIELANARRAAVRAALLNDLALLLNRGEPVARVFDRILRLLEGAIDFDFVSLMTRVGDTRRMVTVGAQPAIARAPGDSATFDELLITPELPDPPEVWQFRTDKLASNDRERFAAAGIRRMGSVYLQQEGELLGLFAIGRHENRALTANDTAFMSTVGGMLSQAIANERRLERPRREAARAELLNSLALLLNAGEPVERLFDRILALLEQAITFDYVSLMVRPGEAEALMMAGSMPALGRQVGDTVSFAELLIPNPAPAVPVVRQYRPAHVDSPGSRQLAAGGLGRMASVVLHVDGDPLGLFSLGRKENDRFEPDDEALIETVSAMLTQAIANQRRLERTQREAARAGLLNELAVLLSAGEVPGKLFERLVEQLRPALPFDHLSLLLAKNDSNSVWAVGAITHTEAMTLDSSGHAFGVDGLPIADAVANGQLTRQFQPGHVANEMTGLVAGAGIQRVLTILLRDGDRFIGLLNVGRARPERFAGDEVAFTEVLGSLVGQALVNHLRIERAEQSAARSLLLNELAVLLNRGEPIDRLFERAVELLGPVVPFDLATMYTSDEAREGYLRFVGVAPAEFETPASLSFAEIGFDSSRPIHNIVRFYDPRTLAVPGSEPDGGGLAAAALCVLHDGAEFLGFFTLCRRDERGFTPEETKFLEVLATLLAQALAQSRRLKRAESESARRRLLNELSILLHDGEPVTALFSRLPELMAEAIDFEQVGLAMRVDMSDRFMSLNWNQRTPPGSEPRWMEPEAVNIRGIEQVGLPVFQFVPREDGPGLERVFHGGGLTRAAVALLRHSSETVGVLNVGRYSSRPFASDEMDFLAVVGQLLAQAIANQLRIARSAAEAEDERLVAEAASLAAREADPQRMTRQLRDILLPLVPEANVNYGFVEGDHLLFADTTRTEFTVPIGSHIRQAMDQGQASGGKPSPAASLALRERLERLGTKAWAMTAARVGGQVTGMLVVVSRQEGYRFGERELRLLRRITQAVGPAIANSLAEERVRQEAREQRILAEVASVAARESEPLAIAAALAPALAVFIPDSTVAFGFIDGEQMLYHQANGHIQQVPFGAYIRAAIADGQVVIEGLPADLAPPIRELLGGDGIQSHILTAARSGGTTIGILVAGTRDPGHRFAARDRSLLERVASIVGPAMANGLAAQRSAAEAAEQRIVAAIAAAAARESSPHRMVEAVLQPLLELIPRPFLAYGYIEGEEVVYPRPDGTLDRYERGELTRLVEAIGQVVADEIPDSVPTDSGLHLWQVRAVVGTAARAGGVTVGILLTGSRQAGYTFSEREQRIFRLVAQIIGAGMETARASQRALQEAEEQRLLADIAAAAAREPDEQALLASIVQPMRRIVPQAAIGFAFVEGGEAIHVAPNYGLRLPLHEVERRARDTGQVVLQRLPADMLADHPGAAIGGASAVITATYSGGLAMGLLSVGSRDTAFAFGEREQRLLRLIAQIVGPAMENARRAAFVAAQSALYQLMFRSLSEAVILLDGELRTVFANAPGQAIIDLIDPQRRLRTVQQHVDHMPPAIGAAFARAATMDEPSRGRGEFPTAGEPVWYDFEIVPIHDQNYRLLVVATDVTEVVLRERRQEEQREQVEQASRLAALGELIGGVAHELNNPLTAILGFAEVLSLSATDLAIGEELGIIQKEALRARNIVRDLLLIARPGRVEPAVVNLHDVVEHVSRLRRNSWLQQRIAVRTEIDPAASAAWGNETQLTQVLLNLVTNAEQATEGRQPREITIRVQAAVGHVILEVADNGAGMDEQTAARVFEPFFTTKHSHGTGLGLSLSYSIVRAHDGTIDVQSRPGAGTAFRITLPAAPAQIAAAAPPGSPPAPLRRARVLVIDDEPSLRKVCQRLVASMGHECSVAETAAQAVAIAASDEPDLILCDYRLATETADEVVRGISEQAPMLLDRIVIATGATTDAGVVRLIERFGLRLLAKPYGFEEIARLIEAITRPESLAS